MSIISSNVTEYKGVRICITSDGMFYALIDGAKTKEMDSMKEVKKFIDSMSKNRFERFKAWVKDDSWYNDENESYCLATILSLNYRDNWNYRKEGEKGFQQTYGDIFEDSRLNEKVIGEIIKINKELATLRSRKEDLEKQLVKVDKKKYRINEKGDEDGRS